MNWTLNFLQNHSESHWVAVKFLGHRDVEMIPTSWRVFLAHVVNLGTSIHGYLRYFFKAYTWDSWQYPWQMEISTEHTTRSYDSYDNGMTRYDFTIFPLHAISGVFGRSTVLLALRVGLAKEKNGSTAYCWAEFRGWFCLKWWNSVGWKRNQEYKKKRRGWCMEVSWRVKNIRWTDRKWWLQLGSIQLKTPTDSDICVVVMFFFLVVHSLDQR